jgi:acyl-CoA synthetase (AMP-forming)/AMP-acid ligase II
VETRVRDGQLEIRSRSAMLGYLNAPSPFTKDGWLRTRDRVEVDGEFIKILGRESDLINVGGLKVFPAEVESAIQELDNVAEATVFREKSALVGELVCARVRLRRPEPLDAFRARLKRHCARRLERHKVPVKVSVVRAERHSPRFKKRRDA